MSHGDKITKTYIIDESLDSSVFIVSACTAVHTNALYSCSGDTSIFLTSGSTVFSGDVDVNGSISGNTFYGDGSQLTGLKATFSGLTDTNLSGVTDGQIAIYDSGNNEWVPGNVETTFSGLTDTSFSGLTDNDQVIFNSSTGKWENITSANAQYINAYDSDMDGTSIPGSGIDVSIDTEQFNNGTSTYTLLDPVIRIEESGVYKIDYKLNTRGGGRATSYGDLFVDQGSGFQRVEGSRVFCYNRTGGNGYNTGYGTIVLELQQGDRIKLRAFQNTGSGSLMADQSSMTVSNHRGPRGSKGEKGDTGSLSGTVFNGHFQMDGVDLGNISGSVNVDLNQGNVFYMTLSGNTELDYSNANKTGNYLFIIEQDGSGGNDLTYTSSKFQSPGGNAPEVSKTVNAKTLITGTYDEVNNKMMVFSAKEMNDI